MPNILSKDRRIQTSVTLPTSKTKKLQIIARRENTSLSRVIERGVDAVIHEEERND